jgi:hypothetical protein
MQEASETRTISLERPRKVILHVTYWSICITVALVIAYVPLTLLSKYG